MRTPTRDTPAHGQAGDAHAIARHASARAGEAPAHGQAGDVHARYASGRAAKRQLLADTPAHEQYASGRALWRTEPPGRSAGLAVQPHLRPEAHLTVGLSRVNNVRGYYG